jgi:SAM-dependent methyltransferase
MGARTHDGWRIRHEGEGTVPSGRGLVMTTTEEFQLPLGAAEQYEARFVPAIFAEWARVLTGATAVTAGQSALDVACGTGIVARTVADRLGSSGRVVGVDLNSGMLTVARRVRPDLEWLHADAAGLPFPDGTFDAVLCQMALMFFPDKVAALREMARVARPGGVVALAVPASLGDQPAYGPFVAMATDVAGPQAASLLATYWACGELPALHRLVREAGLEVVDVRTHAGTASFGSADELAVTEVEGSPLAARISEETYATIRSRAREVLAPFTAADGRLAAPLHGHVVVARAG